MTVMEVANGAVRDTVRAALMATARLRGGIAADLFSPAGREDPYPVYARLRELGPVATSPLGVISAQHATVNQVLRNPATTTATAARGNDEHTPAFQRWLFGAPRRDHVIDPSGPDSIIGMDGPAHARVRRLLSGEFTPAAVARLRPRLTTIAHDLLERVAGQPTFDLMADFADTLPVLAVCEVLGIPERDHRRFKAWGNAVAADLDAMVPAPRQRAATRALAELGDYFAALIEQRRRDPGDDMISRLALVEQDGDRLSDREVVSTSMLLLIAGFETTTNLVGNGTLALLRNRDQLDWLRADLARVPNAVEELLRYDAPVQMSARFLGEPMTAADGTVVPAGSAITLFLGAANRDPEVFADPDRLDLARPDARKHLAFASGPHFCLGAALARLEGEVAFTALLEHLGDLRPAGTPVRRPTFVLRGMDSLPLETRPGA